MGTSKAYFVLLMFFTLSIEALIHIFVLLVFFTVSIVALISGDVNSSLDILRSAPVSILQTKKNHNVNDNNDNDEAIAMPISISFEVSIL